MLWYLSSVRVALVWVYVADCWGRPRPAVQVVLHHLPKAAEVAISPDQKMIVKFP
jgi:hypothetical protein